MLKDRPRYLKFKREAFIDDVKRTGVLDDQNEEFQIQRYCCVMRIHFPGWPAKSFFIIEL